MLHFHLCRVRSSFPGESLEQCCQLGVLSLNTVIFRVVARTAWGIVGYLPEFLASRHQFHQFLLLQQQKISPNVTKHPQREGEINLALAKVCYSKAPATLTFPSRLAKTSVIWKPSPLMAKSSKGSKKQLWLPWWYGMSDVYLSTNVKFKFSKRRGFSYNKCCATKPEIQRPRHWTQNSVCRVCDCPLHHMTAV